MKNNIRCIIVDDEPLAVEVIESYLNSIGGFTIVAKCNNALIAYQVMQKEEVDLIFLDIQMPKLNGINFIKSLNNPPKVIITTAYRDYAIEGYDLDVVDYLLKPIRLERFIKAIDKFSSSRIIQKHTDADVNKTENTKPFLYLKSNRKTIKTFCEDIVFIEGMKDYILVHTKNSKLVIKEQMKDIEERLIAYNFIRVHKSYIVSLDKITAFNTRSISIDKKEMPIGRNYKNEVLKRLGAL